MRELESLELDEVSGGAVGIQTASGSLGATVIWFDMDAYARWAASLMAPGYHQYDGSVPNMCSAEDAFAMLMEDGAAPGAPPATGDITRTVELYGGNPITQTINTADMTILNQTLPGHDFHPGYVEISVAPLGANTSTVSYYGEGNGAAPAANWVIGHAYFGNLAQGVATVCAAEAGLYYPPY